MRRRDIFDVFGERYTYFWNALTNRIFLYEEETLKRLWKIWFFWEFIPLDCHISSTNFRFNALKLGLSFINKTKTPYKDDDYEYEDYDDDDDNDDDYGDSNGDYVDDDDYDDDNSYDDDYDKIHFKTLNLTHSCS